MVTNTGMYLHKIHLGTLQVCLYQFDIIIETYLYIIIFTQAFTVFWQLLFYSHDYIPIYFDLSLFLLCNKDFIYLLADPSD